MSAFAALLGRELSARWPAIAAASLMGLFVALVPFLPGETTTSPAELRGIASAVVLATWSALLAILVGATLFSREVGGGSFAFRLPAAAFAHWAARLGAALALLLLSTVVLLLPSVLAGFDSEAFRTVLAAPLPAAELGAPLPLALLFVLAWILLLALANAFALALRSRSAWSTLDFASAAVLAGAILSSWRALHAACAPGALWLSFTAAALLLIPGWLVAGARQVSRGRGEADRAQRAHATALLVASVVAAVGTVAFARWSADPSLDDLSAESAFVEPIGGNLAVVGGPLVDRVRMWAYFLLDLATGESHRLPLRPGKSAVSVVLGSADGRRFGWFETDWNQSKPRSELVLFDAANPNVPEYTAISSAPRPDAAALSPSAKLVAVADQRTRPSVLEIIVTRISPAAVVRTVAIESCAARPALWFVSETRLVVECVSPGYMRRSHESLLEIHEIDLESGQVVAREPVPSAERLGEPVRLASGEEWRSLRRCDARPCRLVAQEARQGTTMAAVGLLDEATGVVSERRNDAMVVRNPSDPDGLVLLSDSAAHWIRFDPASGELLPVFAEALYGRSARLYGW